MSADHAFHGGRGSGAKLAAFIGYVGQRRLVPRRDDDVGAETRVFQSYVAPDAARSARDQDTLTGYVMTVFAEVTARGKVDY